MVGLKDYLEVIVLVVSIVGVVWQVAKTKADVEIKIDQVKDEFFFKLTELKHEFSIHVTEYEGKKEAYSYRFHSLDETLKHKFQRCWDRLEEYYKILDELKIAKINHSNELNLLGKLPPQIQQIQGFLIKSYNFAVRSSDVEG